MGKQVTFHANAAVLHEVNRFVAERGWKLFRIEPSRGGEWSSGEHAQLDAECICGSSAHGSYYLVPNDTILPKGKDGMIAFLLDQSLYIELTLFMRGVPAYDSRIWFRTGAGGHEKTGAALLRKVRAVLRKQKATVAA